MGFPMHIAIPRGTKIAVVGDIHEHKEQFDKLIDKIKPSREMILVSVGDIFNKGFGIRSAEAIVGEFMDLEKAGFGLAVKGNHELKMLRHAKKNRNLMTRELQWVRGWPVALSFTFHGGYRLTVVHGGVSPKHTWNDLEKTSEVCYIREVDEAGNPVKVKTRMTQAGAIIREFVLPVVGTRRLWHDVYDGRFGYIVSGHFAQKDGVVKYYSYSCNIDSGCYVSGVLSAQIFDDRGLNDLITVTGRPAFGDLDTD